MIFPAIDLQDGRSVRLYKGDFAKETIINPDPVDQASQYEAAGVGALHLVDLDGTKAGKPVNVDIVKRVRAAFTGVLEIGGGIRDKDEVDLYLEMGVNRVILGSVALKNPELTKQVIAEYGPERIVIGVDGKNGKVAAEGWLDQSDVPMTDLIGARWTQERSILSLPMWIEMAQCKVLMKTYWGPYKNNSLRPVLLHPVVSAI